MAREESADRVKTAASPVAQAVLGEDGQVDGQHFIINDEEGVYYAWPSIARLSTGELLVVTYEGAAHTHAHGKVVLYRSSDEGATWDAGTVVSNTLLDDRDPGILVTHDDTIIVSSRMAWWEGKDTDSIDPAVARELLKRYQNGYLIKSTDGGRTWSDIKPYPFQPKGPIELQDGTLFAVAKNSDTSFMAYVSPDVGDTWLPAGHIFGLPGMMLIDGVENELGYWEPHFVQIPSGRLIVYIRGHALKPTYGTRESSYLWLSYSDDVGRTWTPPQVMDVIGHPPDAILLSDQRVLLTYGYRWTGLGQRARLSHDGVDFGTYPEILIRADAPDADLGYPSSIQLDEKRIMTVYYQKVSVDRKQVLMGTIWSLI